MLFFCNLVYIAIVTYHPEFDVLWYLRSLIMFIPSYATPPSFRSELPMRSRTHMTVPLPTFLDHHRPIWIHRTIRTNLLPSQCQNVFRATIVVFFFKQMTLGMIGEMTLTWPVYRRWIIVLWLEVRETVDRVKLIEIGMLFENRDREKYHRKDNRCDRPEVISFALSSTSVCQDVS